ncbi:plakophilin-4 isoform X3 [Mastacembelus armatus]|uniref:plakophilin-4 isoform X3 n=1 Tax=Mastacembelus armatus TaxID=205130 RepID=UPI000E464EDC|nr:plakophilin-4 isoform X3 [Mastacembelus armatus]XP_026150557.1 plakophilin-4 isoform X3 [Mastacembelus armatus]XP_026150558.1 plakophilin-4 isoform X3 [Mastacembelus armatus]
MFNGGMPAPEQSPVTEEGLLLTIRDSSTGRSMEGENTANNILASVKEQELQFERLTRELEVERQIVANQLERCRVGTESPGAGSSSSSEKSLPWRNADASASGDTKSRMTDSSQSPSYRIRTESEQVSLYSPEQSSLHESEESTGNSHSSTQMNSYSDSGYQDASSGYLSSQNVGGKAELRMQHSFPGTGTGTLMRNARAEGQVSGQISAVTTAVPGRAMRRVSSVPSRSHSPAYASSISPSRGSLRTSAGSAYGSPIVTEPKPLSSIFSTTLPSTQRTSTTVAAGSGSPYSTQKNSPAALRRVGSTNSRSGSASRTTSPYQASAGSSSGRMGSPLTMVDNINPPLTKQPTHSSSPVRASMTAVPQHYSSTLPRSVLHNTDPYGPQSYDIYERMTRPDSLTDALVDDDVQGIRSSYASQHSQLGQDLRSAMSPDRHIAPIYEERTFQGPLYRSPSHTQQGTLYRSASGVGSLQRTSSQRSAMTYQRNNYALNTTATYADPYRSAQYRPSDPNYTHQAVVMDDGATRSPSIDSIQKDPREFAWRDPELTEVIHMLQHHFPSVQANAAAYLQHLCFGDNRIKAEVCRLGGIKHLVDLLDHKALEVQRNSCGALRNLVYGKASDDNKIAVRNAGGIPALLRLLRKTVDAEVRELVTGVLWNLSSCDAVKMTIIRDALTTLTNTVIIPHSGWSSSTFDDDHKLKFHSSLVLRNTTGCLRNLSSAGEEARKQMRTCEGLVDSLLYVIKACVNTSDFDSKIVENCICTLRNLSYRLELEMPPSRLTGGQEPDGLLGSESPSKEVDSSCWGRKKKKKKKSLQEDTWDGVGPIPGFSKSPKGAETLWHPAVVKPYLTLLAESSNPATLEGAAGSLQNLSAGNWKFAAYIRAAVRKEKGLPILVELLRMDNDRVVCSVATALRNMALDVRNKELIGKYAMRDLVNRLPGGNTTLLSDETVAAICCTLHEVTSKNMENAKALADTGGIEKLVNITKGRGDRYSMKVVKAAAQVLNTLWQYRDLRAIYKKDGWNQNHFLTPVSTLERDRFKSQPTLPTSTVQMSPVNHPAASATSSPAMLGIKEHRDSIRDYQRAQSTMQFYNYQGDNTIHKKQYTGSGKPSSYYYSPTREEPRRVQPVYYTEDPGRRNYDTYRMYLQHPHGYDDPYLEEVITYPPTVDYNAQPHRLKSTANYVDFYASTRRPSYRAEQYPGSPDSWV